MPVRYEYDAGANIVHARPFGELTVPEVRAFFEDLMEDPAILPGAVEVVHFFEVEDFLFTTAEAEGIVAALPRLRASVGLRATVFVADRDVAFGVSRMLQILYELEDPGYRTAVVRGVDGLRSALDELAAMSDPGFGT